MFQATRRRLALWYTAVTAVLLLLFASGVYWYVRSTLVERVDDTLNHVVEIVQRSLVIEPSPDSDRILTSVGVVASPPLRVNVEDSFRDNAEAVEGDHIDLEWFSPQGTLLWSTFSAPPALPLHVNPAGETVHLKKTVDDQVLRQVTRRIQQNHQVLGYLRVSHPWFEVSKPSRQLLIDLSFWSGVIVLATAAIGWLLSGLAMAPVLTSYEQLKQFTADASHELRNPIAVIQTNVQVALSDPEPDMALQQSQLQVIERLTRRLGRLVDNLLFLARQESGLVPMQVDAVDLQALLKDVLEEQSLSAQEKGLVVTAALSPVAMLWGDADQLTRLFTNLLANAIQYTATGTVTLQLGPGRLGNQPALTVQVQDTGIGMTAAQQARVFDRFYRVDRARSRRQQKTGGSGLGLAIVKAIVDNHEGQISLASQLQVGTIVTVTLPERPKV